MSRYFFYNVELVWTRLLIKRLQVRRYACMPFEVAGPLRTSTMDGKEKILPATDFRPYNSTSLNSVMLSPTTLPAEVVAEVFPLPQQSRRSSSHATGFAAPDGSGRLYNCSETPMPFCDSPFSRFCTGDCRTNGLSDNAGKADVVRFLNKFPKYAPDDTSH